MFDELKATIRHDVTHTIFRVTVVQEPQQPVQRMQERREDVNAAAPAATTVGTAAGAAVATASNGNGSGARQPVQRGPKIGRNDPCWCGSGKKYKRCHGA